MFFLGHYLEALSFLRAPLSQNCSYLATTRAYFCAQMEEVVYLTQQLPVFHIKLLLAKSTNEPDMSWQKTKFSAGRCFLEITLSSFHYLQGGEDIQGVKNYYIFIVHAFSTKRSSLTCWTSLSCIQGAMDFNEGKISFSTTAAFEIRDIRG